MKHTDNIKQAFGVSGVFTETSAWRHSSKDGNGAQVDLLLDRQDNVIRICEMKFSNAEFAIDKTYAAELKNKLDIFRRERKTKKALFLAMVPPMALKTICILLVW
ncbi:ATPase [Pedobacter frigidisoli]|uniref:ATPase n=1 Tax=Pedobacter frigidisoli TaxID=2530455 RepID=UPI001CEC0241|nr:ATPase [Pedobacter frigidisoli]